MKCHFAETENEVPVVERIKSMIQEKLTEDLTVGNIAEDMGMSMYYMCHLFKKTTGITIMDYKNELRIARAKDFLACSDKKITDIALECGFSSASYFSKVFMMSEKISPKQYRRMRFES